MDQAREFLNDETSRSSRPVNLFETTTDNLNTELPRSNGIMDPGAVGTAMTDSDLASLRKKSPFLADFSDQFVRSRPMESLLKIETTSMKIREMERTRDTDEKLSANKLALAQNVTNVKAGPDNRWTVLHPARFLPGAACSAAKQWLAAREAIGLTRHPLVGNYDMAAVGLAGFVTNKGWVELHNLASTKLALKMFSINSCSAKAGRTNGTEHGDPSLDEINELGELKLALRTLRTARLSSARLTWQGWRNRQLCIGQNADRWRDAEPFLSTRELKTSWNSFFGARPQAALGSK